jgi:myo-inositol 2-dehydrogenase/D-chiro-inositol 1-dehydrogenase
MEAETIHFLDCVAKGRQPLVTPEHARMVMQVYQAADQSAEEGRPIEIVWPASDRRPAGRADFVGASPAAPARTRD